MKVLVFSLALLLMLTYGEALVCSRCVPATHDGPCTTTEEKCGNGEDACVRDSHFRRCIKMSDCRILQADDHMHAYCCNTDHCNA